MSFFDEMISKLTDLFKKTKESNIGKLFFVIGRQFDDLKFTLDRMDEWRDIDNAQGVHLDKLGSEIVQEYRNGQTDEQYRLRIKTKIIANLSKGDIETINNVLSTFIGDSFIGVKEMWSIQDPLIDPEPAGILITTETHTPFPAGVIGRVTAGGISVYWHIIMEPKNIVLQRELTQGVSDQFVYSGELYCGPIYDVNTAGISIPSGVNLIAIRPKGEYEFPVVPDYSGAITDSTSGSSKNSSMNIQQSDSSGLPEYQYSGDEWSEGVSIESDVDVNKQKPAGAGDYRYAGEIYSGEG
ncbi:hypothetical protein [Mycobacteroides abscessus]|uniref:hypothetical protein n=1 Tax=Mycobacteroides abscessus TaxID=36809 RepID=UPI000C261C3A